MGVALEEVQAIGSLSQLSLKRQEYLASLMVKRTYQPGELIFLEGEEANGVWFILNGRVRILKTSLNGRVQTLCITNRGKCFGGCPLFNDDANPATAQALEEVELLVLPGKFSDLMQQSDPDLLQSLLQIFSQRITLLARLSEGLGAWTVATRINDNLIQYSIQEGSRYVFCMTHEKLAELAGTVREVVTRHLSKLEKRGVICSEPGKIVLLQMDYLRAHCPIGGDE